MNSNKFSDYQDSVDQFELSCASGDFELVTEYLDLGVLASLTTPKTGASPLHFAAQSGSVEVVLCLLKHGVYLTNK